jgi:hypothetical protein
MLGSPSDHRARRAQGRGTAAVRIVRKGSGEEPVIVAQGPLVGTGDQIDRAIGDVWDADVW